MNPSKITTEEYTALQQTELTEEQLIKQFVTRVDHNYQTDGFYYPTKDASHNRSFRDIFGYTINYSFPVGRNTPIASFWTFNEADYQPEQNRNGMSIFHIDVHKLISHFVKQANDEGYKPPLTKEKVDTKRKQDSDEVTY